MTNEEQKKMLQDKDYVRYLVSCKNKMAGKSMVIVMNEKTANDAKESPAATVNEHATKHYVRGNAAIKLQEWYENYSEKDLVVGFFDGEFCDDVYLMKNKA